MASAQRPALGGWAPEEVEAALRGLIARTQHERALSRDARALLRATFDALAADVRALAGPAGSGGAGAAADRVRLTALLVDVDARLGAAYRAVRRRTLADLTALAGVEADAARAEIARTITARAEATATPVPDVVTSPAFLSAATIESVAAWDIQGRTLGAWWEREARDMAAATKRAIQLGVLKGEAPRDIAARLVPPRGGAEPAVWRQANARAHAVVRTAITAVQAHAAAASYADAGDELTDAYEILATRDARTSPICLALDGQRFRYRDPKRKMPPFHVNCRSTIIPAMNWGALGIPEPGPRDPLGFPSMAAWLKAEPAATQNALLGRRRAQWFREGRLPLRELIDGDTRVRTLAQLRAVLAPASAPAAPAAPAAAPAAPRAPLALDALRQRLQARTLTAADLVGVDLRTAEDLVRGEPLEHAVAYRNGALALYKTSGKASVVAFSDAELRDLAGTTFTHNHPSGTFLSRDDGEFFLAHGLAEIRAATSADLPPGRVRAYATRTGAWVLRRRSGAGGPADAATLRSFRNAHARITQAESRRIVAERLAATGEPSPDEMRTLGERVWTRLADQFGFEFTFEDAP